MLGFSWLGAEHQGALVSNGDAPRAMATWLFDGAVQIQNRGEKSRAAAQIGVRSRKADRAIQTGRSSQRVFRG